MSARQWFKTADGGLGASPWVWARRPRNLPGETAFWRHCRALLLRDVCDVRSRTCFDECTKVRPPIHKTTGQMARIRALPIHITTPTTPGRVAALTRDLTTLNDADHDGLGVCVDGYRATRRIVGRRQRVRHGEAWPHDPDCCSSRGTTTAALRTSATTPTATRRARMTTCARTTPVRLTRSSTPTVTPCAAARILVRAAPSTTSTATHHVATRTWLRPETRRQVQLPLGRRNDADADCPAAISTMPYDTELDEDDDGGCGNVASLIHDGLNEGFEPCGTRVAG